MTLLEKLLEREILLAPEDYQALTPEQRTQLEHELPTLSNDQVEQFITRGNVEILKTYTKKPQKRTYQHFVGHFNNRLENIGNMLRQRAELISPTSISNLRKDQKTSIIGLVWDKKETKNGHIIIELEDKTGRTKVLINKKNEETLPIAKDVMLDEVIGMTGSHGGDIFFADTIIHPDIPVTNELKKAPEEVYAVFLADLHCGGKEFYKEEFQTVINWLKGEAGNDTMKAISKKIKYLFIVGDLIEGAGIYPGQEKDLEIIDVKKQYEEFAKYIHQVPDHIQIIACPGNHDAGRLAEPQMNLYSDFAQDVLDKPNIHMVSNPSVVRIHRTNKFSGFNVLMYHGYSYIYIGNNVPSIFEEGGVNRPDLIMKYLLQRRHLAPSHTSNLYIPDPVKDPLIIEDVPDFFVSGHIHMGRIDSYKGVQNISCSCWVPKTEYQEMSGLEVDAGKVPLVNLQTRQVKMLTFVKEEDE